MYLRFLLNKSVRFSKWSDLLSPRGIETVAYILNIPIMCLNSLHGGIKQSNKLD